MTRPAPAHALDVLQADHRAITRMFSAFDELVAQGGRPRERHQLARRICDAVTAHAMAETELFYPLAQRLLPDDELLDEALSGHDGLRALVEHIEMQDADDACFDALLIMLARAVGAQIRREEHGVFPRVRAAGADFEGLGERIARRREELLQLLARHSA